MESANEPEAGTMTLFFNRTSEKSKRRFLRNNMTRAEEILWARLKSRQVLGYKFRRQYSVGAFVLDFYSPQLKLAIEVDGESHNSEAAREYDAERAKYLGRFDIRVIRFSNDDVYAFPDAVLERITRTIQGRESPAPATLSPPS